MITRTAFQPSAFQRNGFQIAEAVGVGSGDLPPWLLAVLLARKKKKKQPQPEPVTQEEIVAAIAEIRSRFNLKPRAPVPAQRASLVPLQAAARARGEAAELAEFRALVESALDADEWLDAA